MNQLSLLLSPPNDLEVWLIVGYVLVVLAGARLGEAWPGSTSGALG